MPSIGRAGLVTRFAPAGRRQPPGRGPWAALLAGGVARGVVRGVALGPRGDPPALAFEFQGEEVVQDRPDGRYCSEQDHLVYGRGDGRGEYVGPELELEPQRQVAPEVQPYLVAGVLPGAQQAEHVPVGRRRNAEPDHGDPYSLDHEAQVADRGG